MTISLKNAAMHMTNIHHHNWGLDTWINPPADPRHTTCPSQPSTQTGITVGGITTTIGGPVNITNTTPIAINSWNIMDAAWPQKKTTKYWSDEEIAALINYKNPKEIAKKGVFVPGKLYKFSSKIKDHYITHKVCLVPEHTDDPIRDYLATENHITPISNPLGIPSKDISFLCLETVAEQRRWTCQSDTKGNVRILDRYWKTTFLVEEKIYSYTWYENEQTARTISEELENNIYGYSGTYGSLTLTANTTTATVDAQRFGVDDLKWPDYLALVERKA